MTFLLFLLHYKQFFLSFENLSPLILKIQEKTFYQWPFIAHPHFPLETKLSFLNHASLGS